MAMIDEMFTAEDGTPTAQVTSNGRTVWATAADGSCVGRFSEFGIDLHRTVSAQMRGEPECLDCTHELPHLAEWRRFQTGAQQHHAITIADKHMPRFIRKEIA